MSWLTSNKKLIPLFVCLLVLIPLVPPDWIKDWDNYQFIIFSAVPVLYFGLATSKVIDLEIKLNYGDIGWLVFIAWGFLSYYWAINGSLVWYQLFGSAVLLLWILLIRGFSISPNLEVFSFWFFSILLLLLLLPIMYQALQSTYIDCREVFGYHRNYVGCYALMLLPYVWFYQNNSSLIGIGKVIITLLVLFVLYHTNSRGAIIAFAVIGVYYFWAIGLKKYVKYLLGGMISLIGLILFLFLFFPELITKLPVLGEFDDANELDRWYMARNSIRLFLEHPLTGVGLGNWRTEAYKYGVNDFAELNNPVFFVRYGNHNLYTQYLAELGTIGFIGFGFAVIYTLWHGIKYKSQLGAIQKAAYSSLIIYLIASFFYQSPNFYPSYFSGLQLLTFMGIGLILNTNYTDKSISMPYSAKVFLWLCSIASFVWFIYAKQTYDKYIEINQLTRADKKAAIKELEALYHPVFKQTHGVNQFLDVKLAQLYESQKDYDTADNYYQKALQLAPYNENTLLAYSRFLLTKKEDIEQSQQYAMELYRLQNNAYPTALLLAEIAFVEGEYKAMNNHLFVFEELEERIERRLLKGRWNEQMLVYLRPQISLLTAVYNLKIKRYIKEKNWLDAAKYAALAFNINTNRFKYKQEQIHYLIKAGATETEWLAVIDELLCMEEIPTNNIAWLFNLCLREKKLKWAESIIENHLLEKDEIYFQAKARLATNRKDWKDASTYWERAIAQSENPSLHWYSSLLASYHHSKARDKLLTTAQSLLSHPKMDNKTAIGMANILQHHDTAIARQYVEMISNENKAEQLWLLASITFKEKDYAKVYAYFEELQLMKADSKIIKRVKRLLKQTKK